MPPNFKRISVAWHCLGRCRCASATNRKKVRRSAAFHYRPRQSAIVHTTHECGVDATTSGMHDQFDTLLTSRKRKVIMPAPKTYTKAQWDEFARLLDALPEKPPSERRITLRDAMRDGAPTSMRPARKGIRSNN
ncbi:integrase [Paraburkholderia youngii]|uniref:hypothetical protein n=1 Tax=Paraburkholderia youngii TaxID=2782701 RepID=UPI003D1F938D